jgi:hypothetical protein
MEDLEDIGAALIADYQASDAAELGQRAPDHPAARSQVFAGLDVAPGDPISILLLSKAR